MLHHADRPLAGESPCRRRKSGLCVHVTAVALAYLGDTDELRQALTRLTHTDLVALLCDLADRSEQTRRCSRSWYRSSSASAWAYRTSPPYGTANGVLGASH